MSPSKRPVLLHTSQFVPCTSLQPFFTTKPTGRGTALGLSLSYDIVKSHGGQLTVDSVENSGSEFNIILQS
jgi:signal transduction histidine kinase